MGDFNFHSNYNEQQIIYENGYADTFLDLNNGNEDWTMPGAKGFNPWRPDKVITPPSN